MISPATEALVALENAAPDVLFECLPGTDVPLWPLMRWPVAKTLLEVERDTFQVARRRTPLQRVQSIAGALGPNRFHSSHIRRQADALFVVSGTTLARTPDGVKNWLVDDHAFALGSKAVVVQDAPLAPFAGGANRPLFRRTFSYEDVNTRIMLATRKLGFDARVVDQVTRMLDVVYGSLDLAVSPERKASAKTEILGRLRRVPFEREHFARLLDRVQPTIAFVQTAAYGERAHLIALMHERGIEVAEHQHGFISSVHQSYNFGAAMSEPPLRHALPDTLLTFGDYWGEGLRFPGQLAVVGKPHLDAVASAARPITERTKRVLVVSSAREQERVQDLTLELRDQLDASWTINYRPHPAERARVTELYPRLAAAAGVSFDLEPDVATTLSDTVGVIGFSSTVLFEALAFNVAVAVIQSPISDLTMDASLFARTIDTRAAIAPLARDFESVHAGTAPTGAKAGARLWASDAATRFERFITPKLEA